MATESYCTCSLEDECGIRCLNRIMQYECDDTNCRSKEVCQNRAFATLRRKVEAKFDLGIETYKTRSKGYGLKTKRAFERDQIIVEYTGEIVTREQSRYRRTSTRKADQVSLAACLHQVNYLTASAQSVYMIDFDKHFAFDATFRGSIARFVNHSCNPNCRMERWIVGGEPGIALFAGEQGIAMGEELTFDYNFQAGDSCLQQCHCGEERCTGVLGRTQSSGGRSIWHSS